MSPARLSVRAVVVSDGRSRLLPAVIDAVLRQDPGPDHLHIVLTDGAPEPVLPPDAVVDIRRSDAQGFAAALNDALAGLPGMPQEYLWLLHDDSAPEPGALAALTATARKRRLAGVIGAAQVRWDDPSRLVGLGATVSRIGARRLTLVEEDDINQGQYHARDDVLAVSMAGVLVRRDVWDELDGLDPAYGGWGEGVDLCRRAWRAGHDVVVVPSAHVRHRQESLYGTRQGHSGGRRTTYGQRRSAEWFHRVAYGGWWSVLPLVLWAGAASVARALLRITQNDPGLAAAELAVPWRLVASLRRLPGSRRRVRAAGRTGRGAERPLLAGGRQVLAYVRSREAGAYEQWRASIAPSDVVRAELHVVARRRRRVLGAVLAVAAAVSVVAHGDWLASLASGRMLAGEALGVTDMAAADLWSRAVGGWSEQALGMSTVDAGLVPLLLPLALVPGGLALSLGVLMALAPVVATLGAWAATGAFTRSLPVRALTALAYGMAPGAVAAIESGRVAALTVHLLLPCLVVALARAGGWHCGERVGGGDEHPAVRLPSPSAAAAAALVMAALVMAAPVLVIPGVVVLIVLGAVSRRARWRLWAAAVPALVVAAPGLLAAIDAGVASAAGRTLWWREPGPTVGSETLSVPDMLAMGVGLTGVPGVLASATVALAVVAILVAAVAAVTTRRWVLASVGIAVAVTGVVLAVGAQSTAIAASTGMGHDTVAGWRGAGLSVAAIGALILVSLGGDTVTRVATAARREVPTARVRRVGLTIGAGVAVCAVAVLVGAHAVAVAWPSRTPLGDVHASDRAVLPLVAELEQRSDLRTRVLVLDEDGHDVVMAVLATDGSAHLADAGAGFARAGAEEGLTQIAEVVARMAGGGEVDPSALAEWGIGAVVAAPGADGVVSALSQYPQLSLMGASDRGSSWRIARADGSTPVGRAWIDLEDGSVAPVTMERSQGAAEVPGPGTVVLAVPAGSGWTAHLDGARVEPGDDALGRQAFAVDRAGALTLTHESPYRWWWWASLALLAWSALAAIPLRQHRFREAHA